MQIVSAATADPSGSLWLCLCSIYTHLCMPNTHCLCNTRKSHSARLLQHPLLSAHTHTPFGCNKTADQSHWVLTGTDTETCCCWKAAWEMFITHRACRFGQEKNSGLIKWRPGAAVGEIHTRPRRHPHVLWQSLKPLRILIGCEWGCKKEKKKEKKFGFCFQFRKFAAFGLTDRQIMTSQRVRRQRLGTESGSWILLQRNATAWFSHKPAAIDWSFWCPSGLLYNSHKKRFNIPEYGWTRSLVSIVTLLSISLNIALLSDFSPAQIIKHSWRGGRCVDTDNNVSDSRQRNDLLACQNKPMSRCIYSPNRG